MLQQMVVNTEEAKHASWFVAGARPFILWACGAAFAWQFVVGPIGSWITLLIGHPTPIPVLDMGNLMPVLLGILGLGGYRTYEKVRKADGNSNT